MRTWCTTQSEAYTVMVQLTILNVSFSISDSEDIHTYDDDTVTDLH